MMAVEKEHGKGMRERREGGGVWEAGNLRGQEEKMSK